LESILDKEMEDKLQSNEQKWKRKNRIINILITKQLNKKDDNKQAITKTLQSTATLVAN